MQLYRIVAVAQKEAIHIVRDKRSLAMAIAIPILLLLLFGSSLSLDVKNVPFAVWDRSQTQLSRNFISHFAASRYFQLVGSADSYAQIDRAINERRIDLAIVIPADFASRLTSAQNVRVQFLFDGSNANTATIALGYVQSIVDSYNQQLARQAAAHYGRTQLDIPLLAVPRLLFNQNMDAKNYIIPGLIAVIMMVIAALLTSLTIAREWENGTMEQLLTTPLTPLELIFGKLLPYFAIGLCDILLSVLVGTFIFDVPLRGNPCYVFATGAIFLMEALTMGVLISIIAKSQLLASQLAMVFTFLPSFLLSGFMYDISNMPQVVQYITYLVPARYFVTILKDIYLKGDGFLILLPQVAVLLLLALVLLIIAKMKLKRKLV